MQRVDPLAGKVNVAIILARGGSKGLPGKNIRLMNGKPLIAYTIECALKSRQIGKVFVSTDDEAIANISLKFGALVIKRPTSLCADDATSESGLIHAIDSILMSGVSIGYVIFLQCTSPLRKDGDIDKAIDQIENDQADSLLSVCPSHRFLWTLDRGTPVSINYDYRHRSRRQECSFQYVENGSIYIFKPEVIMKYNNRIGGNISLFVMEESQRFEIDSLDDFVLVELIMKRLRDNNEMLYL